MEKNMSFTFPNPIACFKYPHLIPYIWRWQYGRFARKFSFLPKSYAPFEKYKINDDKTIYNLILDALENQTPLMMGRYGSGEHNIMQNALLYERGIISSFGLSFKELCTNAGFFPYVKSPQDQYVWAKQFLNIMLESTANCDIFGTWNGHLGFEEYFIKKTKKDLPLFVGYSFFEPHIDAETPFTYALKDRKVLVIHPFAQTIQEQYKKREKLFANPKVLPSFDLKTFKAIQTINGEQDNRFANWFEALDWMSEEIAKIDFDIALIACGAYGFPLASRIKNMGKIAIHCGGPLQLLFGIKGRRWEIEMPSTGQKLFNEFWVRPNSEETIKNNQNIENGCYW